MSVISEAEGASGLVEFFLVNLGYSEGQKEVALILPSQASQQLSSHKVRYQDMTWGIIPQPM
jgi:hypothetical protein